MLSLCVSNTNSLLSLKKNIEKIKKNQNLHLTIDSEYDMNLDLCLLHEVLFFNVVTHLTIGYNFRQEINYLPNSLIILDMGFDYDVDIKPNILPESLIHLKLGLKYNNIIKPNVLPKALKYLIFGYYYNQEIKPNILPKSLTHLIFGKKYNKEIKPEVLPESLTYLEFGNDFNLQIEKNTLPDSLTHLIFGVFYNEKIKQNILPNSLTHLNLGYTFNNDISNNILPKSLIELTIGWKYINEINIANDLKLPNLKNIILDGYNVLHKKTKKICINKLCIRHVSCEINNIYVNNGKIKKYIKSSIKTVFHAKYEKLFSSKISRVNKLIKKIIKS